MTELERIKLELIEISISSSFEIWSKRFLPKLELTKFSEKNLNTYWVQGLYPGVKPFPYGLPM
jgi:hypothetical protein